MPDSLCYRWALDTLSAQGTWPLVLPHDHNPEASGVVVHSARESSGPDSVKQLAVACINRGGTRQEVDHSLAWTEFHVPVLSAFYIGALTTVKQIFSTGNVWTQGVVPTPEDVRRLVPQVRGVPDVISRVPGLKKILHRFVSRYSGSSRCSGEPCETNAPWSVPFLLLCLSILLFRIRSLVLWTDPGWGFVEWQGGVVEAQDFLLA